jgi:hypothetical protein
VADGTRPFNFPAPDPLHAARVFLAESKARGRTPFAILLLTWAGNARRRAAAERAPAQRGLFG